MKIPVRRVREIVGRMTSRSPINFDANLAVPPFSLAEQRRIKEFPQFSTMVCASGARELCSFGASAP
ncbi:MAG: hypothetical protein MUO39_12100 [Steroidobacteraceae bacterium]|nr:hypothetical protein [Steroidobacteraceae bacterium]